MQTRKAMIVIMSVAVLAAGGCACTSDGLDLGEPNQVRQEPFIEWHGAEGLAGTMTATVAGRRAYSGPYLQVTPDVSAEQLAPLWQGWSASHGWRAWRQESWPDFLKAYDGMVLANLGNASGDRMRCRFQLDFPVLGMDGGGAGKCQFLGGETNDAAFSARRD